MIDTDSIPRARIPVILDTDIGDDIDDSWALALLLRSPELEVKLVTTATGDTTYRARLTARLLEVAGRTDVPVGIGPAGPVRTPPRQTAWVEGYALAQYPGTVHAAGTGSKSSSVSPDADHAAPAGGLSKKCPGMAAYSSVAVAMRPCPSST